MKSLKLSITLIGIFLTTICLAQDPLIDNELNKKEEPVTIADKSSKDANVHANENSEFTHPVFISDEYEQERQAKQLAGKQKISKLQLTNLLNAYESTANYPSEDEVQHFIDSGALDQALLDANGIDKNSKLYKRVVNNQSKVK